MKNIHVKNARAFYDYEILDKYTAGIKLTGTEIKSIRNGHSVINQAYCYIDRNELYVKDMHIAEYANGSYANHEEKRDRKLLLKKTELERIEKKLQDKGLTVIPTLLFIAESGYAKLNIAVARGKKQHDKRDSIKERDTKKDLARLKKVYR